MTPSYCRFIHTKFSQCAWTILPLWFAKNSSLLLLLTLGHLRLLGLVKKLGPLFVCRKLLVGRKHRLRRRHSHSNLQLSVRFSLHHAHGGGDVRIIAAGCCA